MPPSSPKNPEGPGDSADLYLTGAYAQQNPSLHAGDSPWKVEQILMMVRKHGLEARTVCEVGCGAGQILRLLQQQFPPDAVFHGYDIAPHAIAVCRESENERLRFFCQDLPSSGTEPYDLLLCIDVVEHVEDALGFLRNLRRKGRQVVFHIPLEFCARYALFSRQLLLNREQVGHLHYFSRDTALATLRAAGYEILDFFYTPAYMPALSGAGRREKLLRLLFRPLSPHLGARILGGYSLLVLAK